MHEALVDLHMHTTCSDGAWSPERLFAEVRSRGLDYFSVSDHDNMDAYPVPQDLQARCISGLEVDTHDNGKTVHVLAYGVRNPDSELMRRLAVQRKSRSMRALQIIERLNQLGVDLTYEQVLAVAKQSNSVGRPHIARALVETKHCPAMQDAFDVYLAEGCSAYVPLERLMMASAIDLIHAAQGVAILAHPGRLRDQSRLEQLCKLFDGIEVAHPSADQDYQRRLFDLADANNLCATAGTDFHARPQDGAIGVRFPRSQIERLVERTAACI